jgi:hypothetical protein
MMYVFDILLDAMAAIGHAGGFHNASLVQIDHNEMIFQEASPVGPEYRHTQGTSRPPVEVQNKGSVLVVSSDLGIQLSVSDIDENMLVQVLGRSLYAS